MKTWKDIKELSEYKTLKHYVDIGLTVRQISYLLDCSKHSVETAMKHHGIKRGSVILRSRK